MNIEERKQRVLDTMPDFLGWEDKYRHLMDLGKKMEPLREEHRQEKFLVKGCISRAWLAPEIRDGKLIFYADSDSAIVKGILALLLSVYSSSTPEEILSLDPAFLTQVGIHEHLSMNRRNGLSHIFKQIQLYATVSQQAVSL